MPTKVSVQGPEGQPQVYIYDRGDQALGAGNTSVVYAAYLETDPTQRVAIKVVRPGQEHDLTREADIIDRLRRQGRPVAERVPWAAIGREVGTNVPAPCLVMEKVDTLLSAHLGQLGATPLGATPLGATPLGATPLGAGPQTDVASPVQPILERERQAARSGLQYAQLLVGMRAAGIISSGDRKATDFRWLPDGRGDGRLVVLDWNRAQWIDTNLDAERFEQSYIDRRRAELEKGAQGDIGIFAHWWALFLLGRAVGHALPALNDPEPAWQVLTRSMRDILRRALLANRAGGYQSADELLVALTEHVLRLDLPWNDLVNKQMGDVQRQAKPDMEAELERLIDIASRKGAPEGLLQSWRSTAGKRAREAMESARAAEQRITMKGQMRQWDVAEEDAANALAALGVATAETGAAHLLLHRLRVAATLGKEAQNRSRAEASEWTRHIMDAIQVLGAPLDNRSAPNDALAQLRSAVKTVPSLEAGLEPLRGEAELRRNVTEGAAVEIIADAWKKLESVDRDYAQVLRLGWPALERQLSAGEVALGRSENEVLRLDGLMAARDRLFDQFQGDVAARRLPAGDRAAAGAVAAEWRPLWAEFFGQAAPFRADDSRLAAVLAEVAWLDALADALLRQRPDEALRALKQMPPADLLSTTTRHQLRTSLLEGLEATLRGEEAIWPDQLRRAQVATALMAADSKGETKDRLGKLSHLIEERLGRLAQLRQQLGVDDYLPQNDWAGMVAHVTTAGGAAADGRDPLDEALRQAIANRLELWEPAVDLPPGDAVAHEAYRARTLLALRAAGQLPGRLRDFSHALLAQANALEKEKTGLQGLDRHFAAAGDFAAQLARLERLLQQQRRQLLDLTRQAKTAQDEAAHAGELLESAADKLSLRLTNLEETRARVLGASGTFKHVLTAQPRLAAFWLAYAIDQAARLELKEASENLSVARELLGDDGGATRKAADLFAHSLNQLDTLRRSNDRAAWERLGRVKDILVKTRGGRSEAIRALNEAFSYAPQLGNNIIVRYMAQQIEALLVEPSTPPAYIPPSGLAADERPHQAPPAPAGQPIGQATMNNNPPGFLQRPAADSRRQETRQPAPPAEATIPAAQFPTTPAYRADPTEPGPLVGPAARPAAPPAPDSGQLLSALLKQWQRVVQVPPHERKNLALMSQANYDTEQFLKGNAVGADPLQALLTTIQRAVAGMEECPNQMGAKALVRLIDGRLSRK